MATAVAVSPKRDSFKLQKSEKFITRQNPFPNPETLKFSKRESKQISSQSDKPQITLSNVTPKGSNWAS